MTHWDMLKKATKFEFSLYNMSQCVICSPVWAILYHAIAKLQRAHFCRSLLSGHPLLSGHMARSQGCPINNGFTVFILRPRRTLHIKETSLAKLVSFRWPKCARTGFSFCLDLLSALVYFVLWYGTIGKWLSLIGKS